MQVRFPPGLPRKAPAAPRGTATTTDTFSASPLYVPRERVALLRGNNDRRTLTIVQRLATLRGCARSRDPPSPLSKRLSNQPLNF